MAGPERAPSSGAHEKTTPRAETFRHHAFEQLGAPEDAPSSPGSPLPDTCRLRDIRRHAHALAYIFTRWPPKGLLANVGLDLNGWAIP